VTANLPEGRRGRLLALGITLVVTFAIWVMLIAPLTGLYAEQAERLSQRRTLAHHMEQLAAAKPALEVRAAQQGAKVPVKNNLSGGSIPVATAALQSLVQDIATTAGASLSSVESLPGETTGGYRRVGVKLALSASWPVLIRFLQSVEQSGTPMAVDDLQIHGTLQSAQADQPAFETGLSIYASAGPAADTQPQDNPK
jgi:general secretion pathway protein M